MEMYPHIVKIIRDRNTFDETIQEDIPANIQPGTSFFGIKVDIKKGDSVIVPHLDELQIVKKVDVYSFGDELDYREVELVPESEIHGNPKNNPPSIHQEFHGDVGNVAAGDITINNVTANIYFKALEKAVEASEIPPENKRSLIEKISQLKNDPYIKTLGVTAIATFIKQLIIQN